MENHHRGAGIGPKALDSIKEGGWYSSFILSLEVINAQLFIPPSLSHCWAEAHIGWALEGPLEPKNEGNGAEV